MSPEELQSAADHIRMGNYDYNPAGVINVTGTVEGGGRTNNPEDPGAWKRWKDG